MIQPMADFILHICGVAAFGLILLVLIIVFTRTFLGAKPE